MTNLQLLLTIGIPSVLVVLGWMHQNTRISDLRSDVKSDISSLRAELKSEVSSLRTEMNKGFGAINEQFMHFHNVTGRLEGRVDEIAKR